MDEAERAQSIRRLAVRWGIIVGIALVLFSAWRLFVLFCPLHDWAVLGWSLGRADAQTWDQPQIPALVAENALENGGAVGEAIGRRMYAKTLAPAADSPFPAGPPSYASLHLPYAWLGETNLQWSVQAWSGSDPNLLGSTLGLAPSSVPPAPSPTAKIALVRIDVEAHLAQPVGAGAGCAETQVVPAAVGRDYVVVRTALGWRVAYVYVRDPGNPLVNVQPAGAGTPAAILAGCGGR